MKISKRKRFASEEGRSKIGLHVKPTKLTSRRKCTTNKHTDLVNDVNMHEYSACLAYFRIAIPKVLKTTSETFWSHLTEKAKIEKCQRYELSMNTLLTVFWKRDIKSLPTALDVHFRGESVKRGTSSLIYDVTLMSVLTVFSKKGYTKHLPTALGRKGVRFMEDSSCSWERKHSCALLRAGTTSAWFRLLRRWGHTSLLLQPAFPRSLLFLH